MKSSSIRFPKLLLVLLSLPLGVSAFSAETPSALEDKSIATEAIDRLSEMGILDDKEYWLTNVRPGGKCDGELVGNVLIKAASKFEPVDNLSAAVEVLAAHGVLSAPDYWKAWAVKGKICSGGVTASLLQILAKKVH